jgi:PAS domain S-box-containing protein
LSEGIAVISIERKLLYFSPAFQRILGYSAEDVANIDTIAIVHPGDQEYAKLKLQECQSKPGIPIENIVFRARHKKGIWVWLKATFTNFLDDPLTEGIVSNFRDITEEKALLDNQLQLLKELKERNAFIETVLQNIPIGVAVNKIDSNKSTFMNKRFSTAYGWEEDDINDIEHFFTKVYPDEAYRKQVTGKMLRDIESRITDRMAWGGMTVTTKTGEKRIINVKNIPLYNQNLMISTVEDVTLETLNVIELERAKSELEKIMQSSQDMIISLSTDNIILRVSIACETILGYTQEELINKPLFNFIHPEDKELSVLTAEAVMDGKAVNNFENRYIRKDGSVVHLNWSAKWDNKGKIRYGIGRDVTEKKVYEKALLESEMKYRNLFESNPLPLFFGDFETLKFIDCNQAAISKYGYTREEFLQLKTNDLWATSYLPGDGDNPAGQGDITYTHTGQHRKKNGEIIHAEINIQNMTYNGKKGVLYIVNDVTAKMGAEELLNKANNLARIGAWDVDLEKNLVIWSDITREIHEAEPGFVADIETASNFYLEGTDRDAIVKTMTEAARTGKPGDVELRITTVKGNIKWVRVIVESDFENGKCSRLFGSFQDIDKRRKAELAAIDALQERNTILDSIGDGFFAINKNWEITYWNRAAGKILGKPKRSVVNKKLWEIFNDAIAMDAYNKYYQAIATKRATHFEIYDNDTSRWFDISVYPSTSGLSVYFKDITARKATDKQFFELNENLKTHAKELSKSNAELEQFAYAASHDLQEPLRMVSSFLTQLENKYGETLDDRGKQYIHFAVDGAKRMRQIILDLLEFSRVGRVNNEVDTVDINNLVKEVMILCKRQIDEKNAVVNLKNLPTIETFKTPLRQVFQNIISNGLKYQRPGVNPVIDVVATETESYWKFEVKDNGLGIDKLYFEKVFVIFQRLHSREEYSGTGIGLAIARKIIENMGGKIWIDSELDKGTSFYFTVPKKIEI